MSNSLYDNLLQIKQEKDTKLLPQNLKKDVTVLGVTGTLETAPSISLTETVGAPQSDYTYVDGNYIYGETPDAQATIGTYGKLKFTSDCSYCARVCNLNGVSQYSSDYGVLEIFKFDKDGMHYSYDTNNNLLKYRYIYEDFNFQAYGDNNQAVISDVFFSEPGFEGDNEKCLIGIIYRSVRSSSYSDYSRLNIYTFTMKDNGVINTNEKLIDSYDIWQQMSGGYQVIYNPHFVNNSKYIIACGADVNNEHYEYLFDLQKSNNTYALTKRQKSANTVPIDSSFKMSYCSIDGRYDVYIGSQYTSSGFQGKVAIFGNFGNPTPSPYLVPVYNAIYLNTINKFITFNRNSSKVIITKLYAVLYNPTSNSFNIVEEGTIANPPNDFYYILNQGWYVSNDSSKLFLRAGNSVKIYNLKQVLEAMDFSNTLLQTISLGEFTTSNGWHSDYNLDGSLVIFPSYQNNKLAIFYNNSSKPIIGVNYEGSQYKNLYNIATSATADNVMAYKTFMGQNGYIETGKMFNNGALSYTPTTSQQIIPAGYTSGGTISGVTSSIDSNIQADNIKTGITILGVTGTYTASIKTYETTTAMNNDISNIAEGEVVKVDNGTTIEHYIKETTMKLLVKQEDTISPQEYTDNLELVDEILGEEENS